MEDDEAAPKPKAARKPRKAPAPAKPAAAAAAETGVVLSRKALIEQVSATVGGKKGTVKDIVEATLKSIGDALRAGDSLNLPPLGKARVAKAGPTGADGKPAALTIKLRAHTTAPAAKKPAKEALAAGGEEG